MEKKKKSKKERTKEKIFNTAILLFTEKGYENTTVQEITEAADVAKGTFFSHFPTKDAILTYLGEQRLEMTKEVLINELATIKSAREQLFKIFEILAIANEKDKAMTKLVSFEILKKLFSTDLDQEAKNLSELNNIFANILYSGQERGEFRTDFQPRDAADILIGIYFFILLRWLGEDDSVSLAQEYKERVSIVLEGILIENR